VATAELQSLGVAPNLQVVNPLVDRHLQEFGLDRLKVPIATSRGIAAQAIADGVAAGDSMLGIAKRLQAVGATDKGWRAMMIARTEVVRSQNVTRELSWGASGLPLHKRWLSALGEQVRESHKDLHNKTVPQKDLFEFNPGLIPFKSGKTSVPGNSGVGAHDINCRCTATAFDPEHGKEAVIYESAGHLAAIKSAEDVRQPWEKEAFKIISTYYASVEDRTMEILGV
jgi:hypothetical protein